MDNEKLRRVQDINTAPEIIKGGLVKDSTKIKIFKCLKKHNVIGMDSFSQEKLGSEIQPPIGV